MAVKWKMKSLKKKCSFIYANFNHFYPPTSTLNTRSVTLHNSGGSQCVSLGKDDRANATGSWSLRTDGNEGSQASSHPKAGWAQTKALGCVFPGWARVLILSCLQSTLSLHSSPTYSFIVSTLTSFLFFWSVLICPLTHTFFFLPLPSLSLLQYFYTARQLSCTNAAHVLVWIKAFGTD